MRILVSNDDGIYSEGIWILARQLSQIAEVIIVAPDREQSAVGTAVTLRKPLRVQNIAPLVPGIRAYSVEGTPSDSVIVGLGKIVTHKVDLVISGINHGSNLGEDVLISGTVGAAMAGYLRGFPAIAVSCDSWSTGSRDNYRSRPDLPELDHPRLNEIGLFIALMAKRIHSAALPGNIFLNVNVPNIPLVEVKEIRITRLAHRSHVNTVEEGHDGRRTYYMLIRQSVNHQVDEKTDIRAINQGAISITPLHLFLNDRIPMALLNRLLSGLLEEFQNTRLVSIQ